MDSSKREVSLEIPPYLRVYKDGTVERLLYRPNLAPDVPKLPLVIYFHGGGFFLSSAADPKYHNSLNVLVAKANVVLVSVNYRKAPEHPLPAAYEDSWAALKWVASHMSGGGSEDWLSGKIDFSRVFLAGDSAGANMSHHFAIRVGSDPIGDLKLRGVIMIHPYFWGEEPIGEEKRDTVRKSMVDEWWRFVCPSDKGNDDPLSTRLWMEPRVFRWVEWEGEIVEIEGVDHVFHIMDPSCEKALYMVNCLARFINQE
ncbi:hypothetical protein C3L33_09376, partial [Rhododendron williamsianum]